MTDSEYVQPPKPATDAFPIGSYVKLSASGHKLVDLTPGCLYQVQADRWAGKARGVLDDAGDLRYIQHAYFVPVDVATPYFQEGDIVRARDGCSQRGFHAGRTYLVCANQQARNSATLLVDLDPTQFWKCGLLRRPVDFHWGAIISPVQPFPELGIFGGKRYRVFEGGMIQVSGGKMFYPHKDGFKLVGGQLLPAPEKLHFIDGTFVRLKDGHRATGFLPGSYYQTDKDSCALNDRCFYRPVTTTHFEEVPMVSPVRPLQGGDWVRPARFSLFGVWSADRIYKVFVFENEKLFVFDDNGQRWAAVEEFQRFKRVPQDVTTAFQVGDKLRSTCTDNGTYPGPLPLFTAEISRGELHARHGDLRFRMVQDGYYNFHVVSRLLSTEDAVTTAAAAQEPSVVAPVAQRVLSVPVVHPFFPTDLLSYVGPTSARFAAPRYYVVQEDGKVHDNFGVGFYPSCTTFRKVGEQHKITISNGRR